MRLFATTSFLATASALSALFVSFLLTGTLEAVTHEASARGVDVFLLSTEASVSEDVVTTEIVFTNDGTPLNVMEAEVLFDPAHIEVTDITFGTALCEERFIIDRVIDNEQGRVHMSCGTISPFRGTIGVFGTIHAKPRQSGLMSLLFGEKTHVYVADGAGTEIVRHTYPFSVTLASGV